MLAGGAGGAERPAGDETGGEISPRLHQRLAAGLDEMLAHSPFLIVPLAPVAAEAALRQMSAGPYCRTLDRLHLGAMEVLRIRRLLTNDDAQAEAARALGFSVLLPR